MTAASTSLMIGADSVSMHVQQLPMGDVKFSMTGLR